MVSIRGGRPVRFVAGNEKRRQDRVGKFLFGQSSSNLGCDLGVFSFGRSSGIASRKSHVLAIVIFRFIVAGIL